MAEGVGFEPTEACTGRVLCGVCDGLQPYVLLPRPSGRTLSRGRSPVAVGFIMWPFPLDRGRQHNVASCRRIGSATGRAGPMEGGAMSKATSGEWAGKLGAYG